ncbi:MAG TPA: hypothetical protein VL947_10020, partial [Cytophagales bacterium]|nr:hypothetical protein [Cytophagales bacterium]
MQKIFSRRSVLYVCYATMLAQGLAQGMGDFTSIKPLETRPDSLVIPKSHTFQYILKTGDTLGDHTAAGAKFDFTGYVPINGSTEGWLSVSSEKDPGEVAVLRISLD